MDTYYHFTSMNNLGNISMYGLIPKKGFRTISIQDDNAGVFLSKGINKSIQMYAFMLHYYEKYFEDETTEILKEYETKLEELKDKFQSPRIISKIEFYDYHIKRINSVRNCKSFIEYLEGPTCLLSITGIKPYDERELTNCRHNSAISPDNINLVNLRNKYTNYYIYDINIVLSYILKQIPINEIKKDIPLENHEDIDNLYNYINNTIDPNYDPNYFELVNVPLSCYNFNYPYMRTIR